MSINGVVPTLGGTENGLNSLFNNHGRTQQYIAETQEKLTQNLSAKTTDMFLSSAAPESGVGKIINNKY